MAFGDIYRGKRVLLTGHTGFKGAWLAEWLLALGAKVTGLSLPPPTKPALFDQLELAARLDHRIGDIRDSSAVRQVMETVRPDFVFHLAAQSLVRYSYTQPVETYATNVMGTVHVLDAIRLAGHPCTVIAITTDKCYENQEWVHSYREADPMGGRDPYSSSKGAAELSISAYRRSYFPPPETIVRLASARSGNVIGGGDWALDRIVPDCIRALQKGEIIAVRNSASTRPWQHVLEPLSGYLQLGAFLHQAPAKSLADLCTSFNFGPGLASNRPVGDLVTELLKHWPGQWKDQPDPTALHEARLLNLAIEKAFHLLHWHPVWSFEQSLQHTVDWYRRADSNASTASMTRDDIAAYVCAAKSTGLSWATPA